MHTQINMYKYHLGTVIVLYLINLRYFCYLPSAKYIKKTNKEIIVKKIRIEKILIKKDWLEISLEDNSQSILNYSPRFTKS